MTQFPVILLNDLSFLSNDVIRHAHLDRQRNCREVASDGAENFGEASCTECTGQGNDFELIPMAKMEINYPVEGSFGNKFPSTYNHCGVMVAWSRKTLKKNSQFFACFGKTTPYGKCWKFCSKRIHRDIDRRDVYLRYAFKFREIWPTGHWWNCALFKWQK